MSPLEMLFLCRISLEIGTLTVVGLPVLLHVCSDICKAHESYVELDSLLQNSANDP